MSFPEAIMGPGFAMLSEGEQGLAVNSGMVLVVPTWKIQETLDAPELVEMREVAKTKRREEMGAREGGRDILDNAE